MPQINRVRIINFSYNNNHRNIVDEIFDFFQGENALLNLKEKRWWEERPRPDAPSAYYSEDKTNE